MPETSPSSRRAWIEIDIDDYKKSLEELVALLAEGVDRNVCEQGVGKAVVVALLAEGVDRNTTANTSPLTSHGRPPRGGRG